MKAAFLVAAAAVALVLLAVLALVVREARSLDGVAGTICLLDNTKYALRYTETAFREVSVGMSERDALRLLGEPLSSFELTKAKDVDRSLFYSYRIRPGWYRLRTLVLFHGKVVSVAAECTGD